MAKDDAALIDPNWSPPLADAPKVEEAPKPDPEVLELKTQLEAERRARADAEKQANALAQNAHKAQLEVADSQLTLINSAIERVKESRANIRSAKAQASAAGDWDAVAQLDEQMADEAARLLQLENGKASMEAQAKPDAPQPIRTMPADPVEHIARQLAPRSAAWIRAHPEYVRDLRLNQKMLAAHNLVVADGVEPDTDEYFDKVESTLGLRRIEADDVDTGAEDPTANAAKPAPPRQAAPPAAPVRGGAPNGRGVRLTPAEREAAEISGMTEQEYAAAKQDMVKQGRMH